uniref:Ubiquitin carboxyl-terminal hydrolase n=1 Tax=Kalanchoe fedtschenkoi TaxID=63787 RepID=A0A7N0U984_KALFE
MTIVDSSCMMESGAICLPCLPEEERRIIKELIDKSEAALAQGNLYFVVSNRYKGGPELPRKLISQGLRGKTFAVEVYPLRLNLIDSRNGNQSVLRFSKQASIRELYEKVCALLGLLQEKIRIWDYFNKHRNSVLEVSDKSLQEANLEMDQDILLEVSHYGSFPSELGVVSPENGLALGTNGASTSILTATSDLNVSSSQFKGTNSSKGGCFNPLSSRFKDMEDGHASVTAKKKEEGLGLAGLQNLGNTCFMNSALQCLAHTPPIVEYFLQDYTDDINTKNPLGMHGELAIAFGDLLRKLWSSGRNAVAPRVFKGKLGRFAPQFSGYNQHDSQELLAFLLDGLHEDLNRVKQKPYIDAKDYDGRPDKEVAEECWKNHKARNDSIIVDICQGQYKSTLVCPDCGKISITFDPFMYLSLPLPSIVTRTMTVTVFYSDGSGLPMPYTVTVTKSGCLSDLIQALASACCLTCDERLLLAEVYGHKIYQYLENLLTPLSNIKNEDRIVAYRLPKLAGLTRLEIIHQYKGNYVSDSLRSGERKLLGFPLVTYIEEDCLCGAVIDRCVTRVLSPLKKSTYLTKSTCNKDNAFLPSEINSGMDSLGTQTINQSIVDEKDDEMSNSDLTFHLCLVDSGGKISSQLKADTLVKLSQSIKVLLDWSDKEHELYDATYLEHIPEVKAAVVMKKTRQEAISLSSCLEAFLKEEPLGPDDMWYCPGCKEHRQATKKLDLWRLPEILVFHLKRFSYNRYMKNKLDAFVNFPIHNLDLSKYIGDVSNQNSNVYELYAISNHYGGLGGGHYTAMVKLIEENKWYHFDDSHVSSINEADIKTSAAYVLFYRRVQV